MTEFSREKASPVEVSAASAEADKVLSSPRVNLRQSPFDLMKSTSDNLGPFDGNNPPTIGPATDDRRPAQSFTGIALAFNRDNSSGLRMPSDFANRINQGSPAADSDSSASFFTGRQLDSQQSSPGQVTEKSAAEAPSTQSLSAQPLSIPRREIVIRLSKRPEVSKPDTSEKGDVTKGQVLAERKEQLPKRVDVTNPAEMKRALEKAAKLGVPVVAYFGATWCGPCGNLKRNVLSKMEGSSNTQAVFVHIDVDKATNRSGKSDGGAAIAKSIGVPLGNSVPQVNVLALSANTGRFRSVAGNLGATDYQTLKNNIPRALSAEYVAQNRQKLLKGVSRQFA